MTTSNKPVEHEMSDNLQVIARVVHKEGFVDCALDIQAAIRELDAYATLLKNNQESIPVKELADIVYKIVCDWATKEFVGKDLRESGPWATPAYVHTSILSAMTEHISGKEQKS